MASSKRFFGDTPEAEKATRAIAAATITFIGCLAIMCLLVGIFIMHHQYTMVQRLRADGITTTGQIMSIEGLSGRGSRYRISFKFDLEGGTKFGATSLGEENVDGSQLDDIRSSPVMHIVYDRHDPSAVRIDTLRNPARGHGGNDPTWLWSALTVLVSLITTAGVVWALKAPNWTVY